MESGIKKNELYIVKDYLNSIEKISKVSFLIKVGSEIVSSDRNLTNLKKRPNFILHAPRKSLVKAIKLNIFDDLRGYAIATKL